jgi:hypothetical protein
MLLTDFDIKPYANYESVCLDATFQQHGRRFGHSVSPIPSSSAPEVPGLITRRPKLRGRMVDSASLRVDLDDNQPFVLICLCLSNHL